MAVPPAPDGDAVGDQSDSSDTTPSDSTRTGSPFSAHSRWILAGAVAVVLGCLLASLVAFGRAGWSLDGLTEEPVDPQAQREEMMAVAQRFAVTLDSYSPKDLDEDQQLTAYAERVEKLMTAKAFAELEPSLPITALGVAQGRFTSESEAYAVGVAEMDEDSGRVLVAGTVTLSQPAPKSKKRVTLDQRTFRFEVVVIRTGGEWLVDDYGAAGTLNQPTEPAPTDLPTGTPGASPTDRGGDRR